MPKIDLYPQLTSPPEDAKVVTGTAIAGDKFALDVAVKEITTVSGTFTPSGLSTAVKNTTMNVGDTATALPATALSNRNGMIVTNLSAVDTLYIGDATVTADRSIGTTAGHEIPAGEGFQIDVTDSVTLYGRAEAGKTVLIKIMEVA